jgi:hypothetical protein
MTDPNDNRLTEAGQDFQSDGAKVLLIACGAIAREVLAIIKANRWRHIDLRCLPAIFHNTPEKILPAVRRAIESSRDRYKTIHLLYADCGTGGQLAAFCREMGIEMLSGPHCYSFFEGNEAFSSHLEDEITAFYLTDFLVRQFDAFVVKPLGLDRHPELREMYFGQYEKLVYLAQTDDRMLDKKAAAAAGRLGIAYERRKTGYGDLQKELGAWIE